MIHARVQSIKFFHLQKDETSHVPQKVFLIEEKIKGIKSTFRNDSKIIGLMGTKESITNYLIEVKNSIENKVLGEITLSQELNFSLEEDEKAAIYMVNMEGAKNERTIFLAFLTREKFFYDKPYDKTSIMYLLMRFLGDLCGDIILLYDKQIQDNFQEENTPFTKKKVRVKGKVEKVERVNIPIYQVEFDVKKIQNFDKKYYEKISLNIPVQTKYIVHTNKVKKDDYQNRMREQLYNIQEKLWKIIFFEGKITNIDNILFQIEKQKKQTNAEIVKKLFSLFKKLKLQLVEKAKQCYYECMKIYKIKNQQEEGELKTEFKYSFEDNIYYYALANSEIMIKPKQKSYRIIAEDLQLMNQIIKEICFEEWNNAENFNIYFNDFKEKAEETWKLMKTEIGKTINEFFNITQGFFNKDAKTQQIIDVFIFPLKFLQNKEDEIVNIYYQEPIPIVLYQKIFQEKMGIPSLSIIKNMMIFDLKNNRKAKLLWMNLQKHQNCKFSSVLMTIYGNDVKILKRYSKENLTFTFNSENQKGYLMNVNQNKMTHFVIDSIERVMEEKVIEFHKNFEENKIICYSVTISMNEKIFYLTQKRNILFVYDLAEKQIFEKYKEKGSTKYLTLPHQKPYEYIKTFTSDLYIILGNDDFIDIIYSNETGEIITEKRIKVNPQAYLGVSILTSKTNQFLLIHDKEKSKALVFKNLNCEKFLNFNQKEDSVNLGNPILDVFYEAYEKFGEYVDYENDERDINLYHLTNIKEKKIQTYAKELKIPNHIHHIWKKEKGLELFYSFKILVDPKTFMKVVLTRIPLQLCTLEDGNISPMIRGKRQNNQFIQELSVAERSKILDFGIIEQIMMENPNEKIMVISVMGAQSTGKSYLMNRLFGTRFTVASSRTTIGIWISLIKTPQALFLVLDCEGLFAPDRSSREQEKLVKVLASLSDHTILNINMSLVSRSFEELLGQVAESAHRIKKSTGKYKLYQGDIVIVVRDVTQSEGVIKQFQRMFNSGQRSKINQFFTKLFNEISIQTLSNFKTIEFGGQVKGILKNFIQDGKEKETFRTAQEVLEALKVIVTQLSCDDVEDFDKNMESYKIEIAKSEIEKVWMLGESETQAYEGKIREKVIKIQVNEIVIEKIKIEIGEHFDDEEEEEMVEKENSQEIKKQKEKEIYSQECLCKFDEILKKKVIGKKPLKMTEFRYVYEELNEFIKDCFDKRYRCVEKTMQQKLTQDLKGVDGEKKEKQIQNLMNKIRNGQNSFRLCMQKCAECFLPCIKRYGHKQSIKFQELNYINMQKRVDRHIKEMQPNKQEQQILKKGLENVKSELAEEYKKLQLNLNIFKQIAEDDRKIKSKIEERDDKSSEAQTILKTISKQNKEKMANALKEILGVLKQLGKQEQIEKIQKNKTIEDIQKQQNTQQVIKVLQQFINLNQNSYQQGVNKKQNVKKGLKSSKDQQSQKKQEINKIKENIEGLSLQSKSINIQNMVEQIKQNEKKLQELQTIQKQISVKIGLAKKQQKEWDQKDFDTEQAREQLEEIINSHKQELSQYETQLSSPKYKVDQEFKKLLTQYLSIRSARTMIISEEERQTLLSEKQKIIKELKRSKKEINQTDVQLCKMRINTCKNRIQMFEEKQQKEKQIQKVQKFTKFLAKLEKIQQLEGSQEGQKQLLIRQKQNAQMIEKCYGKRVFKIFTELQEKVQLVNGQNNSQKKQESLYEMLEQFMKTKKIKYDIQELCVLYQKENKQEEVLEQVKKLKQELQDQFDDEMSQILLQKIKKANHIIEMYKVIDQFKQQDMKGQKKEEGDEKYEFLIQGMIVKLSNSYVKTKKYELPTLQNMKRLGSQQKVEDLVKELDKLNLQNEDEQSDDDRMEQNQKKKEQIRKRIVKIQNNNNFIKTLQKRVKADCEDILGQITQNYTNVKIQFNLRNLSVYLSYLYKEHRSIQQLGKLFEEEYFKTYHESIIRQPKNKTFSTYSTSSYNKFIVKIQRIGEELQQDKQLFKQKVMGMVQDQEGKSIGIKQMQQILEIALLNILAQPIMKKKQDFTIKIKQLKKQISIKQEKQKGIPNYQEEMKKAKQNRQKEQKQQQQVKRNITNVSEQITQKKESIDKNKKRIIQLEILMSQQNMKMETLQQLHESLQKIISQRQQQLKGILQKVDKLESIKDQNMKEKKGKYVQQLEENKVKAGKVQLIKQEEGSIRKEIQEIQNKIKINREIIGEEKKQQIQQKIQNIDKQLESLDQLEKKVIEIKSQKAKMIEIQEKIKQLQNDSRMACSCSTDHLCDEPCQAKCEGQICDKKAGHTGDHICKKLDHKCTATCQYDVSCQQKCSIMFGHDKNIIHNCGNNHTCPQKCKFCSNLCKKTKSDGHEAHQCGGKGCKFICILCNKAECSSDDHAHDDKAQIVKIKHENEEIVERTLHLCKSGHNCKNVCTHPGICSFTFADKKRFWKQNQSQTPYNYVEQTQKKSICSKYISAGKIKHEGSCQCNAQHKCTHRCPDCKSICELSYGHQGKHQTLHRNQESMIYAADKENKDKAIRIEVGSDEKKKMLSQIQDQKSPKKQDALAKKQYIFNIGDVSTPTTCYGSCDRKGRGHYHLIECKGGDSCLEQKWQGNGAKHSKKVFYPYLDKRYDMVLCKAYWDYYNFEMPNKNKQEEYSLCNYVCNLKHDEKYKNKTFFCKQVAWHSLSFNMNRHTFDCKGQHKTRTFKKLQICFLLDISGSMNKFIEECKKTIKQIINDAKNVNEKYQLVFSVVGYRDHPMKDSIITQKLKLTVKQKKSLLPELTIKDFQTQELSEHAFNMFLLQLQEKYKILKRQEGDPKQKLLQIENYVLQYHYPFPFDIPQASEDFVYVQKRAGMVIGGFAQLLGVNQQIPLIDHLKKSLQFYDSREESDDDDDDGELIQQIDFTQQSKCLQFLQQLNASGGGDPPEAVLDGMDAVTKLKWSKQDNQTLKYVFHIFDAPPHGRQYAQNNGDRFPDGCPCKKTHEEIIQKIKKLDINYVIFPLTERVEKTMKIFDESGLDFSKQKVDKEKPEEFTFYASSQICTKLEQNDILIQMKREIEDMEDLIE